MALRPPRLRLTTPLLTVKRPLPRLTADALKTQRELTPVGGAGRAYRVGTLTQPQLSLRQLPLIVVKQLSKRRLQIVAPRRRTCRLLHR